MHIGVTQHIVRWWYHIRSSVLNKWGSLLYTGNVSTMCLYHYKYSKARKQVWRCQIKSVRTTARMKPDKKAPISCAASHTISIEGFGKDRKTHTSLSNSEKITISTDWSKMSFNRFKAKCSQLWAEWSQWWHTDVHATLDSCHSQFQAH